VLTLECFLKSGRERGLRVNNSAQTGMFIVQREGKELNNNAKIGVFF